MSDTAPNTDQDADVDEENETIKTLRREAKEAGELRKTLADRDRTDALAKAKIDPDSDIGKAALALLKENKDADLTGLAAAAAAIATPIEEAIDEVTPSEKDLTAQRQALATGAVGDTGTPDVHPHVTASKVIQTAMGAGKNREAAIGEGITELFKAAASGDQRVIYQGPIG